MTMVVFRKREVRGFEKRRSRCN